MRKLFDFWAVRFLDARHRGTAEALDEYWLQWLEDALSLVSPEALEEHGRDPVSALRSLSARNLLAVDEVLRISEFYVRPEFSRRDGGDDANTDAYLFVASCSHSGLVRERATLTFAKYPGPLAVAAGLIRSTDWVAQVRKAGWSLVKVLIPHVSPPELARTLELALRLKERQRVAADLWQKVLEPKLRASESHDALCSMAFQPTGSRLLRRMAFEYLILGESDRAPLILARALAAPDPQFGLWALAKSEDLLQSDQGQQFLQAALTARHAAVRREALRRFAAVSPGDSVEKLRGALFDSARAVRNLAAFELNRTYGESALPIWRAALDESDPRRSELALRALCDSGERQDVERIATDGVGRNASLRAAILRGLARTESTYLPSRVVAALQDPSALVIRQVGEICRRGVASVAVRDLEEALEHASDRRARSLIGLSAALGKWDRLECLLRASLRDNTEQSEFATELVDRWMRRANQSFVVPSDQQVQRLLSLSKDAQARHPKRKGLWPEIEARLAAFK